MTRASAIVPLFGSLTLMLSGCIWGTVKDARTGQPIPGAQVTFRDATGNSGTITTNAGGLYAFDATQGPLPAAGPVTFEVSAPGYQTLSSERDIRYDDNADGTWEIQSFALASTTGPPPDGSG